MSFIESKRILVIEDDRYILETLVELLTEEGYSVSSAVNGEEALTLLKSMIALPHLILLDLMMPIKDGLAFRQEQKCHPKLSEIPVVLMSADGQIDLRRDQLGLKYHLKKPIDLDQILTMMKDLCAS